MYEPGMDLSDLLHDQQLDSISPRAISDTIHVSQHQPPGGWRVSREGGRLRGDDEVDQTPGGDRGGGARAWPLSRLWRCEPRHRSVHCSC